MRRLETGHHLFRIFERGINFLNRARWITPLAGGLFKAVTILIRIRRDQDAIQSVFYEGSPLRFRGRDEQALHEVLIAREYAFLTESVSVMSEPKVLDVGAHIGCFGVWILSVNEKARVVSVEADPQTYSVAALNVAAFTDAGADWRLIQCAAGSKDGIALRLSDAGPSMSHHVDPRGKIEVQSISLPTLLDRISPGGASVDLAKVDIEGSEEAFLCTNPKALKRVRSLVIELHPQLCDAMCVLSVLKEFFNHIEEIGQRESTKPLLYCSRVKSALS